MLISKIRFVWGWAYQILGRGKWKNREGGHKPGKLREFEKLLKSQRKLREIFYFCRKTWKTQGKCKICHIIVNKNVFQGTFLSLVSQGKVSKYPGNLRESSGNLVSQKCGQPDRAKTAKMLNFPRF